MLLAAASTIQVWTLIVAGAAALSGIATALISSQLAKRAEARADRRAQEAEERADRRDQEAERRAGERANQAEDRQRVLLKVDQLRTMYNESTSLGEEAHAILLRWGMTVARRPDPSQLVGLQEELHARYIAVEHRIGNLAQEMNVTSVDINGSTEIGTAAAELLNALTPGQSKLAPTATKDELAGVMGILIEGLKDYRLAAHQALLNLEA